MKRILIVEDDQELGDGLFVSLKQAGYEVEWDKDGQVARANIIRNQDRFDLVILDLGLPNLHGIKILEATRDNGIVIPVLILTAEETMDVKIESLDHGADDYLTKPYDLNELHARIRALLRRGEPRAESHITYGEITLDLNALTVSKNGQPITISRREFSLLRKLIEHPGRVLTRDCLITHIYDVLDEFDSNVLEVHIHNLRKKLNVHFIRTIRGVGYMIDKADYVPGDNDVY